MTDIRADVQVAQALETRIASLILAPAVGANLFVGKMRAYDDATALDAPHLAVYVMPTEGRPSQLRAGAEGLTGLVPGLRRPSVQVFVRGALTTGAYTESHLLADDIARQLDGKPPDGYCDCRVVGDGPLYVTTDKDSHDIWSLNFRLDVERGAAFVYVGVAAPASSGTAFIQTLTSTLGAKFTRSFTATAAAGEATYYAFPTRWLAAGTPRFHLGSTILATTTTTAAIDGTLYELHETVDLALSGTITVTL